MKEDLNIEELFKQGFENFEGNVDPSAWANISQGINAGATGGAAGATGSGISMFGKVAIIVGAVATTSVGVWYLTDTNESNESPDQEKIVNVPEVNTSDELSDETYSVEENNVVNDGGQSNDNQTNSVDGSEMVNENDSDVESNQNTTAVDDDESTTTVDDNENTTTVDDNENGTTVDDNENTTTADDNESTTTIDVEENKKPEVEANPEWEQLDGNTVSFNANASNHDRVFWQLGDGTEKRGDAFEHEYERPGKYEVIVTVIQENGLSNGQDLTRVYREVVEVEGTSEIVKYPNIFSPNGDNDNDYFQIESKDIKRMNVVVVDMFGNEVFSSNDPDFRWDGRLKDGTIKEGRYVYSVSAVGNDGKIYPPQQHSLTVTLSR